eukprot:Gb_04795 [translate_table: standard]
MLVIGHSIYKTCTKKDLCREAVIYPFAVNTFDYACNGQPIYKSCTKKAPKNKKHRKKK